MKTHRNATIKDEFGRSIAEVILERAITDEQKEKGLKHRTELGENEGMVFIEEHEDYHSVWMKDTILSLDIIFLDKHAKINTIHHSALANRDDIHYRSRSPSKFIIELNGGFCKKYGVMEGCFIMPEEDEE